MTAGIGELAISNTDVTVSRMTGNNYVRGELLHGIWQNILRITSWCTILPVTDTQEVFCRTRAKATQFFVHAREQLSVMTFECHPFIPMQEFEYGTNNGHYYTDVCRC